MTTNLEFSVTGEQKIHCASCEERITRALKRVSGIQSVLASVKDQQVHVSIDPDQITPEQVQARLHEIGYEVRML